MPGWIDPLMCSLALVGCIAQTVVGVRRRGAKAVFSMCGSEWDELLVVALSLLCLGVAQYRREANGFVTCLSLFAAGFYFACSSTAIEKAEGK